jgi:deoxyhypusine synthase
MEHQKLSLKKTLNDKIEQKVINYVAKEVNKNSTKSDVIKLASKMGYSSGDVSEAYDYIKKELNKRKS